MSSMGYYPQPAMPGQGFNQIVRRPMTDAERQLPANFYKAFQKGVRGISVVCLVLFVTSLFVLPSFALDADTYDTISIMMMVFMAVFGLVSIGMSINSLTIRSKVARLMRDGMAVEVTGQAYRASTPGKVQAWTVGPISVIPSREATALLRDGAPTKVLCLPSLKAAIAINDCGLRNGARIMCPANLESMAVPTWQAPVPQAQTPQPIYPQYSSQMQAPQQGPQDEYLPPPPPPPD